MRRELYLDTPSVLTHRRVIMLSPISNINDLSEAICTSLSSSLSYTAAHPYGTCETHNVTARYVGTRVKQKHHFIVAGPATY